MRILIAKPHRPFSRLLGASCILPRTHMVVQAYPNLLRIGSREIPLVTGQIVSDFTIQQDLERNQVRVFGKSLHVTIEALEGQVVCKQKDRTDTWAVEGLYLSEDRPREKLSFGVHKQQDWELMRRRFSLLEILPILYDLGQKIPSLPEEPLQKMGSLISADPGLWEPFLRAAFFSMLVPRVRDDEHQGILPIYFVEETKDPFVLIQAAHQKLRQCFYQETRREVTLLPKPLFLAGRLTGFCSPFGKIDMSWRKQKLEKATIYAETSQEIFFSQGFRFRSRQEEKGKIYTPKAPFVIEKGSCYWLDRFV